MAFTELSHPIAAFELSLEVRRELSPQQVQIMKGLVNGFTAKKIAALLKISESSISTQMDRIKYKLNVRTSWQAVAVFVKLKLEI